MKMKLSKKITAVLLAVLLLLPAATMFAAAAQTPDKKACPEISIHGFMASELLVDKNDDDSDEAWPPSADSILDVVKQALPELAKLSVTRNWDAFADALIPLVNGLFAPSELDSNGDPVLPDSGVHFDPEPSLYDIQNGRTLSFRYDWRLDPLETADKLNAYIDRVLELSGAEQVTLTAHSLGGVIMTTYFVKYGYSKVRSVCYNTTAIYGETYTGELLSGQINLNAEALQNYIKYLVGESEYEFLINSAIDMLKKAGLLDFVVRFGNKFVENLSEKVIPAVMIPLFAHWLTIWAMIPDDYVEACERYVFEDVMKDSGVDYTALRAKIDAYNNEIRAHRDDTLRAINNSKSASLYVISRYGFSSLPLTPSYRNMSDGVIDTKYSSFHATTANYGEKLTAEQIAAGGEYVNPDGTIDASTCMFPDQTWFIRNYPHANNYRSLEAMIDTLLYAEGQATIKTFEAYPQYLEMHPADRSITPDAGSTAATLNFFQRVKLFFEQFFALIRSFFAGLKK